VVPLATSPSTPPHLTSPARGEEYKSRPKIDFIDLAAQQRRIKPKLDAAIARVLEHGGYIMGREVAELETQLSAFCGAKHSITCSNGTDALSLVLMAKNIGPNDAVFCPSFTFAATAEVIALRGATPVFVDILPDTFNMDAASLEKAIIAAKKAGLTPKCIIPVYLFGQPVDYAAINPISQANNLWIMADAAQGFGAEYNGKKAGSLTYVTTTSFFPAKPLGCYGDGGAVFTDDAELNETLQSIRVHGKGSDKYDNLRVGLNARLDTMQAAILIEKLAIFGDEISERQRVANRYSAGLSDIITTPHVPANMVSVWAQYTLTAKNEGRRTKLQAALKEAGVPTMVYYPKPLHLQTAYKDFNTNAALPVSEDLARRVFSLPMHPYLEDQTIDYIVEQLRAAMA
jgi:dTDP-4-amino-4,6-dideoxygalactose transaminase